MTTRRVKVDWFRSRQNYMVWGGHPMNDLERLTSRIGDPHGVSLIGSDTLDDAHLNPFARSSIEPIPPGIRSSLLDARERKGSARSLPLPYTKESRSRGRARQARARRHWRPFALENASSYDVQREHDDGWGFLAGIAERAIAGSSST
jgi:uncharacterized protein (UPF0276 family)